MEEGQLCAREKVRKFVDADNSLINVGKNIGLLKGDIILTETNVFPALYGTGFAVIDMP